MPVGGGISLLRMAIISSPGFALGLTDVVFNAFIISTLRKYGATHFVAFVAIATGSAASIFAGPFVGAFGGRSVSHRKNATIICFFIGATAAFGVGFVAHRAAQHPLVPGEALGFAQRFKTSMLFIFGTVYRAATQASPAVPMCIDAAHHKTKGTPDTSLARIKIGVSWWYIWTRFGILLGNMFLASAADVCVSDLLIPFLSVTMAFYITIVLLGLAMPTEKLDDAEQEPPLLEPEDVECVKFSPNKVVPASAPPLSLELSTTPMSLDPSSESPSLLPMSALPRSSGMNGLALVSPPPATGAAGKPVPASGTPRPSAVSVAFDDMKRVTTQGSPKFRHLYLGTFFYGIANGLNRILIAPFFNEICFNADVLDSRGFTWMAYSGIVAWTITVLHDGLIGSLVFKPCLVSFGMAVVWVGELLLGAILFASLYFVTNKYVAATVFSSLALAFSGQNFFSLVAAGALPPEPRLRPATFGLRATSQHAGELVGSIVAAVLIERPGGVRFVMLFCATSMALSAVSAGKIGTMEIPRFSDMPINANPLVAFATMKNEADFVKKVQFGKDS